MLKIFSLLCLVVPIYGQIPGIGSCPKIEVQKNFDLKSYLGKWYEYERYPFIFQAGGRCTFALYMPLPNNTVSVRNVQINFNNRKSQIVGTGRIVEPAKLRVDFVGVPAAGKESNYWILGTDYNRYAVIYSCTDFYIAHTTVVWVLTRDRHPNDDVIADARKVIKQKGIWTQFLMKTNQDNCKDDK